MFPHISNAFNASHANEKYLKLRSLIYLVLIILLLSAFPFSEARATDYLDLYDLDKNPKACDEMRAAIFDRLRIYQMNFNEWVNNTKWADEAPAEMDRHLARASHFATIYNTFCKE